VRPTDCTSPGTETGAGAGAAAGAGARDRGIQPTGPDDPGVGRGQRHLEAAVAVQQRRRTAVQRHILVGN
jgi:hypothetical protein